MSADPSSITQAPPSPQARESHFSFSFLALCVVGSCLAHGVAYAALSHMEQPNPGTRPESMEVGFSIAPPPPTAAGEDLKQAAAPIAQPPAPTKPKRRKRAATTPPAAAAPAVESAPTEVSPSEGETSPQQPDAIDATSAAIADSAGGAPQGSSGQAGPSGGSGGTSLIDLRRLTSQWASTVNRAISARAIREYPRAALRARVQGTVLLLVHVGPDGRLQSVTVARSSGSHQLDEAALAAARALGAVPAPPAPIHPYLRPFPVPINYLIRT